MTSPSKQRGRFPAHCLIAWTGTGRSPQGRAPEMGEKEAKADGTTSTRDGRHQWQQSSTLWEWLQTGLLGRNLRRRL